ncbi:sulfotransferase family 2 domain-containing protein [Aestuariibacter sp. A3R04]|uniref:sulfotransferase family 2 domain-containing protein n=1 Tax=Aestuariibacter sp. A3R04 TaxID=2841571 RepID=UPI001C083799|nr:sulfotransferase family 2 domain-containing protein [Aestuariibacter sp. A3R04]MBU3023392.1 sulfotransferase family protein [Aestuariibacter sp. A3R04]
MLISHSHSLLFIHIQKTAGTSLTHFLTQAIPDLEELGRPHDPFIRAEALLGNSINNYKTIAFVRNPFDRLVSWYTMIREHGRVLTRAEKDQNPNYNLLWQQVLEQSTSFSEFIENCSEAQDRAGWKPFLYNQLDYLLDANGNVAVDFIGRFEDLNNDVTRMCDLMCIETNHALPHVNKSGHARYREYYNVNTRSLVEARFARDIAYFGYHF